MKKYKLLQDYPILPNTMEVGFEVEWNNPLNAYHHAPTLDVFTKSEVEKYPKFWKLIEIPNFQITSFRGVKGLCLEGKVYTLGADGKFSKHGMSLNCMLSEGNCVDSGVLEILSVRRNVDYIDFTVGDKIAPESFVRDRKFTKIDRIYYNEHNQISYSTKDGAAPKTFTFRKNTTHYKAPIFTTEDGVDMYEGDVYYVPQVDNGVFIESTLKNTVRITKNYKTDSSKRFSTMIEADKYISERILMNRLLLSGQDVLDYLKSVGLEIEKVDPMFVEFLRNKQK